MTSLGGDDGETEGGGDGSAVGRHSVHWRLERVQLNDYQKPIS